MLRVHALFVQVVCLLLFIPSFAVADKISEGDPAPGFELPDQEGRIHTLEDYRDKWVLLYFYPKDDTPGCTTEACEFRDNIFAYRKLGCQVLGISLDGRWKSMVLFVGSTTVEGLEFDLGEENSSADSLFQD